MKAFSLFSGTMRANQRGFTLIEVMVALAVTGVLSAGVATAVFQIGNINGTNSVNMVAVKQVENAVHYLNRDIQQSQSIEYDGQDYWLRLKWISWDNVQNQVTYQLADIQDGVGNLLRNDGTTKITVARSIKDDQTITPPNSAATPPEKSWTIRITAEVTSGSKQATETRTFKIIPRPGF
jgi:prepilin-type N-terminal cleavage/methylation domain-containing protein